MARRDEAYSAARALSRYVDVISEACFEHRGTIPETRHNLTAIDALLKRRLAYRIDDDLNAQLSGVVIRFMNHATKNYRLRQSSGAVADLLDSLRFATDHYRSAQKIGHFETQQGYEAEIQELVYETIDLLRALTQQFAYQVHNEFSTIAVLDIRIRENERCLDEIKRLNALFVSLTVNELYQMAGNDVLLERLLLNRLKRTIDTCHQDLVSTAHRLRETLTKLFKDKEGQRLNHLIDSLHNQYQKNPSFVPSMATFANAPDAFNRITPLKLIAYADLENPLQEETLTVLATEAVAKRQPLEQHTETSADIQPVSDCRKATIEESYDPLAESIELFFDALLNLEKGQPLGAIDAYETLAVDIAADEWLLALVEYYRTRQGEFETHIIMEFDQERVANYSGNHTVFDLIFRCAING
jgi:hypothetical protein